MTVPWSKVIATAVAIAYFLVGRELDLAGWGFRMLIILVITQFLIWFPEELGSFTGARGAGGRRVDAPSPGCAVSGLGWVFLCVLPLWYLFVVRPLAGK